MVAEELWPEPLTYADLSDRPQLTDGRARCIRIALCDRYGTATNVFSQGQCAYFFYEFAIAETIGIPNGCVEFEAEQHTSRHDTLTLPAPVLAPVQQGTSIRYQHAIHLHVPPGEYRYAVGLSSLAMDLYQQGQVEPQIQDTFRFLMQRHRRIANVGMFRVEACPTPDRISERLPDWYWMSGGTVEGARPYAPLEPVIRTTETGPLLGELPPADATNTPVSRRVPMAPALIRSELEPNANPTIFHITHYKAGSQWIHKILRACDPARIVAPMVELDQFFLQPIEQGKIYPTLYITKQQFDKAYLPANSRHFVIIRDLRDTLISAYFGIKKSHRLESHWEARSRSILDSLSLEDGLIFLMDEWLLPVMHIQLSWLEAGERLIRYEDLLDNDLTLLEEVLLKQCALPLTDTQFREIVLQSRFEQLTGGRARGNENVNAHERKGIAGDWQNYFTQRVKQAFLARYGGALVATGYERDLNW